MRMTQDEVGSVLSATQQWTGVDGGPSVQGTGRGHLWGHYPADHSGTQRPLHRRGWAERRVPGLLTSGPLGAQICRALGSTLTL